jgi:hypothetical protein
MFINKVNKCMSVYCSGSRGATGEKPFLNLAGCGVSCCG